MIANKLAGLLATMAFLMLTTTWVVRTVLELPAMEPEVILLVGAAVILLYYFVFGRIVAWIGIRLVQEKISEIRVEEENRRHQALLRQQDLEAEARKNANSMKVENVKGLAEAIEKKRK